MYDSIGQRILTGNSIPIFTDNTEDSDNVELEAEKQYMFQTILFAMGKSDFKESFLSMLDRIREICTFENQRDFCNNILQKIQELYNYEPVVDFEIRDDDDVWQVYNLVAFIEYNHKKFLVDMWKQIEPDLKNFDIEVECKLKEDRILFYIENVIERTSFSKSIVSYLRTNIKENLIKWFCEISFKNFSFIKFELSKE